MTTTTPPAPATGRSPWFRSAPFDLLLILCVPLLTWPLLASAKHSWGPELLSQLILLTATGHYMATFVRAYGDHELFERFRVRFLVAPLVLGVTCISLYASGYGPQLMVVVAGWSFWHWLAQAFGFARIYDIKIGSFRPLTAWLDKALVITGFVATVTLNDGALATFGKLFLNAGIPLPSAAALEVVQAVVGVAACVVLVAYVANLVVTIARGQPWSWQKQFMHVTTIGYYWFAFAWLPNVLIAHVLYELFHDIQYYAITWITCQQRVRRPRVAGWLKRMFQPSWLSVVGFLGVMTAFGGLDVLGRNSLEGDSFGHQVWYGVFLTAALLHYYYDGFIWKARESALGNDLGIRSGLRAAVVPGMRHGLAWSLFFVPLILLVALGGGSFSDRERAEALVAVAPNDFHSQAELGLQLMRARELPTSLSHYRRSVELNPDYAQSHVNYGAALELHGDVDEAIRQYELTFDCPDQDSAHLTAHLYLGCLLQVVGRAGEARKHLVLAADGADPNAPVARLLALSDAVPKEAVERRKGYYQAVLALDTSNLDARLLLGQMLVEKRRYREALGHLKTFVHRAPNYVPGLVALATAQVETVDLAAARVTVAQLLQLEPKNAVGLALQARLGPR